HPHKWRPDRQRRCDPIRRDGICNKSKDHDGLVMQQRTRRKSPMKNAMILSGIAAAAATAVIFGLAPTPAPAVTPIVAPAAAASFTVDPVHSSIVYRIQHNGVAPFYGRFNKVEGVFTL